MTALRKFEVQRSTADTNRRATGGVIRMGNSTGTKGPTVGPQTTAGALTDREVAERFAHVIKGYSTGQLAAAARCTKDGAKHWVDGSRCPSLPKALEMGRAMPVVRDWILRELGVGAAADAQIASLKQFIADEVRELQKRPPAESAQTDLFGKKRA